MNAETQLAVSQSPPEGPLVVSDNTPLRHRETKLIGYGSSAISPEQAVQNEGVREALRKGFLMGHLDGWRGNQLRRDAQHIDVEKSWAMLVEHGAVDKAIGSLATPPAPVEGVGLPTSYAEIHRKALAEAKPLRATASPSPDREDGLSARLRDGCP